MRTLAAILALSFLMIPVMEAKTRTPHKNGVKIHKAHKAKKHRRA